MVTIPVSALPPPAKSVTRSPGTELNDSPARSFVHTNRRLPWISSWSPAASSLVPHTPCSNANSLTSVNAPHDGPLSGGLRPRPGLPTRAALGLLKAYKYLVSPWFTGACRFVPGCADFSAEAIVRHGLRRGSWLTARRLSRCHPWGGHGLDLVPPARCADPETTSRSSLVRDGGRFAGRKASSLRESGQGY